MPHYRFESLILSESEDYIFVNKPPHLATLEDRSSPQNLLQIARAYQPQLQACHRLDKETSGILVFAKNPTAYRHFAMALENREVYKKYFAIADGVHDFDQEEINLPIKIQSNGTVKIASDGKPSLTYVSTEEAYRTHTLLACEPVTGRMHQIRIHLAAKGASLAGDRHYGGSPLLLSQIKRKYNFSKDREERPLIQRVALHAFFLRFKDEKGKILEGTAPFPKDFNVAVKQLQKNND